MNIFTKFHKDCTTIVAFLLITKFLANFRTSTTYFLCTPNFWRPCIIEISICGKSNKNKILQESEKNPKYLSFLEFIVVQLFGLANSLNKNMNVNIFFVCIPHLLSVMHNWNQLLLPLSWEAERDHQGWIWNESWR